MLLGIDFPPGNAHDKNITMVCRGEKQMSLSVEEQVECLLDMEDRDLLSAKAAENSTSPEWKDFVTDLYDRIVQGRFEKSDIEFSPPINRVEHYKLKKKPDRLEYVFIEKTGAAC